jgi:hypothetical protein
MWPHPNSGCNKQVASSGAASAQGPAHSHSPQRRHGSRRLRLPRYRARRWTAPRGSPTVRPPEQAAPRFDLDMEGALRVQLEVRGAAGALALTQVPRHRQLVPAACWCRRRPAARSSAGLEAPPCASGSGTLSWAPWPIMQPRALAAQWRRSISRACCRHGTPPLPLGHPPPLPQRLSACPSHAPQALQRNNSPYPDHGVEVMYRFAAFDPFQRSRYFG